MISVSCFGDDDDDDDEVMISVSCFGDDDDHHRDTSDDDCDVSEDGVRRIINILHHLFVFYF